MRVLRRRLNAIAVSTSLFLVLTFYYLSGGTTGDLLHPARAGGGDGGGVVVSADDPPGTWDGHPVAQLHHAAEGAFDARLRRQSRTPDAAVAEYARRYGRPPPPGFRRWAEYALAHGSPAIDDFDVIAEGVHPLLRYGAAELKRRARRALDTRRGNHVELCAFADGAFGAGCREWAEPLTQLLGEARQLAPDVSFLLNFLDEPSVLLAPSGAGDGESASWVELSHRSIAPAVAEACVARGEGAPSSATRATADPPGTLHFVTNATAQRGLCQHAEYATQHGFVMSPATVRQWPSEIPMLSRAAPHPFSDILFPATHYSLRSSLYSSWTDWRWGRKKNAVYWTGSSTGGEWSHETWRHGHRQRLVALAQGRDPRNFTFLRGAGPDGSAAPSYTGGVDPSHFDVGLTRHTGCMSAAVCDEQAGFFGPAPRRADGESRPLRYRFALDVDGNSFSGRFYRFLASRSVPLKVTIFREWHDERLQPWLHYVPVSVDMAELPELVRFLTSTAKGQWIARRIAEAGSVWYERAMTPTHQGIYLYRLMLELARLQDESREPDQGKEQAEAPAMQAEMPAT